MNNTRARSGYAKVSRCVNKLPSQWVGGTRTCVVHGHGHAAQAVERERAHHMYDTRKHAKPHRAFVRHTKHLSVFFRVMLGGSVVINGGTLHFFGVIVVAACGTLTQPHDLHSRTLSCVCIACRGNFPLIEAAEIVVLSYVITNLNNGGIMN